MSADNAGVRARAVVLYSGGLDSSLACEVLLRAGVDVIVLRHHSVFFPLKNVGYHPPCTVVTRDVTADMIARVSDPQYGLGRNANPCLDCKQMMYGRAWREAERLGAQFIATGEVLGQRPMSQHRGAFARMEKGAAVEGLVVRPLSARLLPATLPEQQGLIRREDMLDIQGRSRRRQMGLAEQWGITDYPTPAGGCKLTDPQYGARVLDLRGMGLMDEGNLRAARHGRFVPIGKRAAILVGRNQEDNEALRADAPPNALLMALEGRPGPLGCVIGKPTEEELSEARRQVVRYSRFREEPPEAVAAWKPGERSSEPV
jgi:tRNA U34 2-thiouridine synthase MnmA/TrmU